jgi:hypothetical protein
MIFGATKNGWHLTKIVRLFHAQFFHLILRTTYPLLKVSDHGYYRQVQRLLDDASRKGMAR